MKARIGKKILLGLRTEGKEELDTGRREKKR